MVRIRACRRWERVVYGRRERVGKRVRIAVIICYRLLEDWWLGERGC
jgi:hypothetical protein